MTATTPNSGKALTGSFNSVNLVDVEDFTFKDSSNVLVYASSNTAGQNTRIDGIHDGTGSFSVLAGAMPAGLVKGAANTLVLSDGVAIIYNAVAMIVDVSYSVNVNAITKANITFGQKPV